MIVKLSINLLEFIFRGVSYCFGVEVKGLENIPKSGPIILACNHLSNFDPVIMGGFAGKRRHSVYFVKKECSSWPFLGWLFKKFGFIFVDRKKKGGDLHALKEALRLKQMESVKIPNDFDYSKVQNIATEAKQKFLKIKPATLGQASRISGVNPSDIAVLSVYLKRYQNE